MVIAVNTIFTTGGFFYGLHDFIVTSFSKLAQQFPQHQFVYFIDDYFEERNITSKNIIALKVTGASGSPIKLQYRLNYKIPALLKKHKADIFVNAGGCCSLRTKVPQCIIINDLSFLHHPDFFRGSWLRFYKTKTLKFLQKAKTIITTSQFLKQEIVDHYKIANNKIDVAYFGINQHFKPVTWEEREAIQKKYTEGVEYFLYSGPIEPQKDLMQLLKAFSFFKKRQKSNMQLVLASASSVTDAELVKSLSSFKYKKEVHLLASPSVETLAAITASAYALVYISDYDGAAVSLTQAMQADVPIITNKNTAIKEICADAALYCNNNDFNDIADKMMLLFKDEDKRNQLIKKGKEQAGLYTWEMIKASLWMAIEKCAN